MGIAAPMAAGGRRPQKGNAMPEYEYRSDYGSDVAKSLVGNDPFRVAGNTWSNRAWLESQGGSWDKKTEEYKVPMPMNNRATIELLYEFHRRGLQWRR
jgi:hypothetical protein